MGLKTKPAAVQHFSHLDMNAVSGRMTLKNTSLATSSVFSTVLVTRVEAYLMGRDKNINYLSSWSCDGRDHQDSICGVAD